jgi:PAS domain-containing protein
MTARRRPEHGRYDPRIGLSSTGGARPRPRPIGQGERLAMSGVGSFDWDLDAGVLDLDDAGLDVFDLRPEEYDRRPESLVLRVTPEEGARIDAALRTVLDSGRRSYAGYFQVTRRDGVKQWTHTQGTVLRDEDGCRTAWWASCATPANRTSRCPGTAAARRAISRECPRPSAAPPRPCRTR